MAVTLKSSAKYRLVDRVVVADWVGFDWWLLHEVSNGPVETWPTWAVGPDGRIYQGPVEVVSDRRPNPIVPLGPPTDLSAGDLELVAESPYKESQTDRKRDRELEE